MFAKRWRSGLGNTGGFHEIGGIDISLEGAFALGHHPSLTHWIQHADHAARQANSTKSEPYGRFHGLR